MRFGEHLGILPLQAGQLLLVDDGVEVDGFTADVTRTFPIGGGFSPSQRRLYEAVLQTQMAAVEAATARSKELGDS